MSTGTPEKKLSALRATESYPMGFPNLACVLEILRDIETSHGNMGEFIIRKHGTDLLRCLDLTQMGESIMTACLAL